MKRIMIHVTERDLEMLNDLVKMKKYPSRAEAIRLAIKDLLYSEHPIYTTKQIDNPTTTRKEHKNSKFNLKMKVQQK